MALMKAKEVAAHLGFSESWVRKMVNAEAIPYVRVGASLRFNKDAIDTWVAAGAHTPDEEKN